MHNMIDTTYSVYQLEYILMNTLKLIAKMETHENKFKSNVY